ncbi:LOW QUALITY PROTEIN: RYamide receptor-like [Homalodisca vitripennis]|uniref:LOW QUALITY PROTEIN: RYamide receptor-like n=1 Tax=Homalodisca vitripennis TaxID=197043 RepID=UPI001EEADABA|nr:LOW QUALITY PROTEIN: RYamide receptor-like [Homalodisca vitripennis]
MCERDRSRGCNDSGLTVCTSVWDNLSCVLDYNLSQGLDCESPSGGALTSAYFHVLVYVLYCAIFLLALLGNGLVCYVVHSSPRMRTVTNLFIVNLAVGDILMTVFCVPFTFVTTLLLQYWPFGRTMCSTVSYSQAISVFVSAYTLVAISIDRFMAIMWPLKPRMGKRQAKVIILIVWLVALLTALPIPLVSRIGYPTHWHQMCDKGICHEVWENEEHRTLYSMSLLVLQYVIPLLVLIFTYSSIAVVVWGKRPPGEAENCRDQRMARSKRKMIKMMVVVVVVFTVCWLPLNVLNLVWESNPSISSWSGLPFLWFAFHWHAMSHTCYNPVIYCWMLQLVWESNPSISSWSGLPFFWFAFHWLAMSHTCYNPVIYCWMNSRFRAGFSTVLHIFPNKYQGAHSQHEHSVLHRFNTSTTYLSSRREPNQSLKSVSLSERNTLYKSKSAVHYRDNQM